MTINDRKLTAAEILSISGIPPAMLEKHAKTISRPVSAQKNAIPSENPDQQKAPGVSTGR